jgi:hypothetical protein
LLDFLKVPFEIIEARDRVGGRLYTHTFPDSTGAPYNYYDVGAMRFPKIEAMWRLWKLLEREEFGLKEKLQKFHYQDEAKRTFRSYNGVTLRLSQVPDSGDVFNALDLIKDTEASVGKAYLEAGAHTIMTDVISCFAKGLLEDMKNKCEFGDGWKYMMKYDHHSVRSYMSTDYRPSPELVEKFGIPNKPIPADVLNWFETVYSTTGMFDRSLTDYILEMISFGWGEEKVEWFCIAYVILRFDFGH